MTLRFLIMVACTLLLVGCSSTLKQSGEGGRFVVEPGAYASAFDASRDKLAGLGFELERIDAHAGVLTTKPLASGGLGTPWDRQQMTLKSEIADLAHAQQRLVRITFVPESEIDRLPSDSAGSQIGGGVLNIPVAELSQTERLIGEVEVTIERLYKPYWRLSGVSVNHSSRAQDPTLRSKGMSREFYVVTRRDSALESELASRIGSAIQD
ncbi:MAG: hypothetical protein Phyf2KO_15970 [Phycisphaerales bacterium]